MRTFAIEQEFLDAVQGAWQGQDLPSDVVEALKTGIHQADVAIRAEQPVADAGLNLRLKGWVLRNEDLPVVEAIGIVATAAAAAVAPGGIAVAAVITAISSFAAMCWKAWRKGAPLHRDEIALLGFLEIHGPMDLNELERKASSEIADLPSDKVRRVLQSLTDVQLRDGRIVSLVRRDASGRWRSQAL